MTIEVYSPALYCLIYAVIVLCSAMLGSTFNSGKNGDAAPGLVTIIVILIVIIGAMSHETKTDVQVAVLALHRMGLAHPEYGPNGEYTGMRLDIAEKIEKVE